MLSANLSDEVTTQKGSVIDRGNFGRLSTLEDVTEVGDVGGKKLPNVTMLNSLMCACWLVSHCRTHNLFDLTNAWKHIVLTSMD